MPTKKDSKTIDMSDRGYKTVKAKDKNGRSVRSTGNGDAVFKALLRFKLTGKDIMQVVRANKLQDRYDIKKYDNLGLFMMGLRGSLRALVNAGTPVVIGDVTVKTLSQRVALEEAKAAA